MFDSHYESEKYLNHVNRHRGFNTLIIYTAIIVPKFSGVFLA